jgi:hypothetical protein
MADRVIKGSDTEARRLQEVAPGEYAPEVYVRDAWTAGVGLGRAYVTSTGKVALSVAGNLRVLISNPTADTLVTLAGLAGLATAAAWATVYRNPTAGLPVTAARPSLRVNPLRGQAPVTTVQVDVDATVAMSGGENTGELIGLPGGTRYQIPVLGAVIPPGQSLGVNVPFAGAADVSCSLYIVEELL